MVFFYYHYYARTEVMAVKGFGGGIKKNNNNKTNLSKRSSAYPFVESAGRRLRRRPVGPGLGGTRVRFFVYRISDRP